MSLLHTLKETSSKLSRNIVAGVIVGVVLLGLITGYGISAMTGKSGQDVEISDTAAKRIEKTDTSAGIKDQEEFPDTAQGKLREGGIEGEGSFHLERPGGVSQNVYLTSTTVDLSEFLGKNVEVWGKTFQAEKAGWLMDVGYIEIK